MKKLNNVLIILSIFASIIYYATSGNYILTQLLLCLGVIPIILAPKIVRKLFKIKISPGLELVYIIFIIAAMVFGSLMGGYSMISWFDSLTHFFSGMLTFIIGLTLLVWLGEYHPKKHIYHVLFAIMFTLSIAVLWECCEFSIDLIFQTDTQKVVETGVTDTMKDMICAFLGSILFAISYLWAFSNSHNNFWSKLIKSSQ